MRRMGIKVNIRRLLVLFFTVVIAVSLLPVAIAQELEGTCGESLNWSYANGVLSFDGTGQMENYSSESPAPWQSIQERIVYVVIPEGISSIGDFAFKNCKNLINVVVPSSVKRIGIRAFSDCHSLGNVQLNEGLVQIDEAAFERCYKIKNIDLPKSLTSIGYMAFWRCESLVSIVVPPYVLDFDMAVFSYCYSLIFADIKAPISTLPQWSFYGCNSLSVISLPASVSGVDEYAIYHCDNLARISYAGSTQNANNIAQDIQKYQEGFSADAVSAGVVGSVSNSILQESENGTTISTTTVVQNVNGSYVSEITQNFYQNGSSDVEIEFEVQLNDADEWNEIVSDIYNEVDRFGITNDDSDRSMQILINVTNGSELGSEMLQELAGVPITLVVQMPNGGSWIIDCSKLDSEKVGDDVDISVSVDQIQRDEGPGKEWYQLGFHHSVNIDSEVVIPIPTRPVGQNVTLYQEQGSGLKTLQTTRIDRNGFAHFYVANIDKNTEYVIGINTQSDIQPIIPQVLTEEFDITDTLAPMDYVITGRKSSWGMEIGQVTWIMAGVLVGSVAVIGIVLFLMNKRKLKKGYVVDLDEYELN